MEKSIRRERIEDLRTQLVVGVIMHSIDYTIYCSHPDHFQSPAKYKVAAEWTEGDNSELKTYGFANDACIAEVYRAAQGRIKRFRPCEGESVGELRIYVLDPKRHDTELERALEIENRLSTRTKLESAE